MVELCIHVANLCYLVSFLSRDMMWLRVLTCLGLLLGLVFFTCQPLPLYGPSVWHVVFLVINGVQICRLRRERRQLMLTEEQERLAEATFHDLSRDELLTLLTRATHHKIVALQNLSQISRQPLDKEERALRDIAFSRLSRKELLNLLTRRLWNSIKRKHLVRWGRACRHERGAGPAGPGVDVASGSVTG